MLPSAQDTIRLFENQASMYNGIRLLAAPTTQCRFQRPCVVQAHPQPELQSLPPKQQSKQPVASQRHGDSALITGLVSAMTESLRLLGVGKQRYQDIAAQPAPNPPLAPGMTQELVNRLTADFKRAYFVTGVIDDSIYDPDCTFVDPTVRFSGVDLWKRNLQLLVPFLVAPSITLRSIKAPANDGPQLVEADWQLTTWLSLPWKPQVAIDGRTVYTLNEDRNKILQHEEFWSVSALAALLMLLKPGPPVPKAAP